MMERSEAAPKGRQFTAGHLLAAILSLGSVWYSTDGIRSRLALDVRGTVSSRQERCASGRNRCDLTFQLAEGDSIHVPFSTLHTMDLAALRVGDRVSKQRGHLDLCVN